MTAGSLSPRVRDRGQIELPPALDAERRELTPSKVGPLSYYVAGKGRPVLLVHSINAAGSAYEVRPIFERMVASARVYAVDLPGFGFSDRSERDYNPRLYTEALYAMLDAIAAEAGDSKVDALAISLSCEFLARAANERPERFRTVTFVTPTGFQKAGSRPEANPEETREVKAIRAFVSVPLWSKPLYTLLVSRRSIRFFLERTFGSKAIDEGLLAYDYLTTHQPGAKNAPYAFVSGRLFSKNPRGIYEKLTLPVWMPHGTRGDFSDFSNAGGVKRRSNWTVQPFETGAMPHFEKTAEFMKAYEAFLSSADAPSSTSSSPSSGSAPSP